MELTEFHKKRNERTLKTQSEQPHVTREEMIEQTKRLMALANQPEQPNTEGDTSPAVDMLTQEEIGQLRQDKKETHDYCQKAFAHLRPKKK